MAIPLISLFYFLRNTATYIRTALRKPITEDTGLTPEEEQIVLERLSKIHIIAIFHRDIGYNKESL